ncbi:MAG: hypothetical protein GF331_25880 [Chitinivibrionales bacterium]|nr:hypothetical protein [Chitinivibrionales bacterium]
MPISCAGLRSVLLCLMAATTPFALLSASEGARVVGEEPRTDDSFGLASDTVSVDLSGAFDDLSGACKVTRLQWAGGPGGSWASLSCLVDQTGDYYATVWVDGLESDILDVTLDDSETPLGQVVLGSGGWQSARIVTSAACSQAKAFHLTKGQHKISFSWASTTIPSVEYVRIAHLEANAAIDDSRYRDELQRLRGRQLPNGWSAVKDSLAREAVMSMMRSSPPVDYEMLGLTNVKYTYVRNAWYPAQTTLTFETDNSTTDPILCFFYMGDPSINTHSDDDGGPGNEARIQATTHRDGYFMLLALSYSGAYPGVCDIDRNGSLYASDAVLRVWRVDCSDSDNTDALNYFTCKISVAPGKHLDPLLFVCEQNDSVQIWDDDYTEGGEFDWVDNARLFYDNDDIEMVIVSAQFTGDTGSCDVYMKCDSSEISNYFPNLDGDDAIKSADSTGFYPNGYNCFAYSGGLTSQWAQPMFAGSPWYDTESELASMDNFYANVDSSGREQMRYAGATDYTRSGATASTSVIDLWETGEDTIVHASCSKPANGHPHGYDWESKPGTLMRTFHPRDALRGDDYGDTSGDHYIKDTNKRSGFAPTPLMENSGILGPLTEEKSFALGLTVKRDVSYSSAERTKLDAAVAAVDPAVAAKFAELYGQWQSTWWRPEMQAHSRLANYAESPEYGALITSCEGWRDKAWPLVIRALSDESQLPAILLIFDLVYPGNERIMREVLAEKQASQYDQNGRYYQPSFYGNWQSFCRKLVERLL